jgi:arginine N-succinyltransferase
MNFIVRGAVESDLNDLYDLARQFSLLNLPAEKKAILDQIEKSQESFANKLPVGKARYLFVLEDLENKWVIGSSQIKAKHGTPELPTYSFQILKKERFSRSLGVGFIHQILRLKINQDGPTEFGGLVVDKGYRRRPEKVGRQMSLSRFMYVAHHKDKFSSDLHSEMAPPLTEEGRSEFWEALGRRFTGMPYQEADLLSHQNKEFIHSLFPQEDIYLCLLDSKARMVLGQVGPDTRPALHLLESIGFNAKNEVDPFDGGPHLGAVTSEVKPIKESVKLKIKSSGSKPFDKLALISVSSKEGYFCGQTMCAISGGDVFVNDKAIAALKVSEGAEVLVWPLGSI